MSDRISRMAERLVSAAVASCTCGTKTSHPKAHAIDCRFRVLYDAMVLLHDFKHVLSHVKSVDEYVKGFEEVKDERI